MIKNQLQERNLPELNDKRRHKLNDNLEPLGVRLLINNAKRGTARALIFEKKEGDEFKRLDTFLLADEQDLEVALVSISILLKALRDEQKHK